MTIHNQGGNIVRKYIYIALCSIIAFLIARYIFNCDSAAIFSGSLPLLIFEIYKFSEDIKVRIEEKYQQQLKERYTKFRKSLAKLQKLARKSSNLFTPGVITLLSSEVAEGLLYDLYDVIRNNPILALLNTQNKSYIKTVVATIREKNIYVKKQTTYQVQILDTINDIMSLFPAFGILLFTLFNLIIIFNDGRTSTKRIYDILNDDNLTLELIIISQNIAIRPEIRLTHFLKKYITIFPVKDDKYLNILITENLLPEVGDLIEQLLWAYSLLDDDTLQRLSDKQRKSTKIDNPPYEFTTVCDCYLKQISNDFDPETQKMINDLYNKIVSMITEAQKLNYPFDN